jgi:hypothetical protein
VNSIPLATRRRRPALIALLALIALFVLSGCLGRGGTPDDPFNGRRADASGRLNIEVRNLNFNDLTVFAIRQGQPIRLGEVTGKTNREFTIAWDFAVPVQFRIDIVGGRQCRIGELPADPGATIQLHIPANVGLTECRGNRR